MKRFILIITTVIFGYILFSCSNDKTTNPPPTNVDAQKCVVNWMPKNLDIDHYRNGDPIPQISNQADWNNLKTGAWCFYNNDSAMGAIYGKLYNWYAVNDPRGLAPTGWHVASDSEWTALTTCLGGIDSAGGKLKEVGMAHWDSSNTGATNASGFTVLPGGFRLDYGEFKNLGQNAMFWTSSVYDDANAWDRDLGRSYIHIGRVSNAKKDGFSIRCVKD